MSTFDPLTPSQLSLLNQIAVAPVKMTSNDQVNTPTGRDLIFLMNAGLVNGAPDHVSQNPMLSMFVFTRSNKAYP